MVQWGPGPDALVSHKQSHIEDFVFISTYIFNPHIRRFFARYHHHADEWPQFFISVLKIHDVKMDYRAIAANMGAGE